jgi:hypothetical protein
MPIQSYLLRRERSRRLWFKTSLGKQFLRPHHTKGLVEWLKVETLNSNPNTAKKKKETKKLKSKYIK